MIQVAAFGAPFFLPVFGRFLSLEEWEEMDEDAPGELVEGVLREEEVADSPHEVVVSALLFLLLTWARPRGGRVLSSDTKYALSPRRGRKPDISVFLTRDLKLPRRGATRHPPDVMIEVVSPGPRDRRRDRIEKLREYADFGVRWYWLLDPEAQMLEVLKLGADGHYIHALDAAEGTIEVPGCAGLTIDLDALWREVEAEIEIEPEPPSSEG